jgi:hypothetical protein
MDDVVRFYQTVSYRMVIDCRSFKAGEASNFMLFNYHTVLYEAALWLPQGW